MKHTGRAALFLWAGWLLAGCGPSIEKVVPDRAAVGDVIDLRDPVHGSLWSEGTVHLAGVEGAVVLSWGSEDVFVEVPAGLTGDVGVHVEIQNLRSNAVRLSILPNEPLLRILCFGDSILYAGVPETLQVLLDLDPYLGGLDPVVMNQGKSAELVSHESTRARWSNALTYQDVDLAILLEGANDVSDNESTPVNSIRSSVALMADEAIARGVDLVLCTLLPRVGACGDAQSPTTEEHNSWLKSYAGARGIPLVDLHHGFVSTTGWETEFFKAGECVHPNAKGNRKMVELLADKIEEMVLASCTDLDGDGYGDPTAPSCDQFGRDCDDGDPSVHPAEVEEACDNGLDDDCDGLPDGLDRDCMSGSCADPAEASVTPVNRVYGASDLFRHVACLLLPVGLVLAWRRRMHRSTGTQHNPGRYS